MGAVTLFAFTDVYKQRNTHARIVEKSDFFNKRLKRIRH